MNTELATTTNSALAISDQELLDVLKSSLYPGAKDESVKMVLSYCRAAKLDPMQKPVHIVPMWVKDSKTGKGEMRDVIMPGIGLYRIQASRSDRYVGLSEPEYGPTIEKLFDKKTVAFPAWCKITVDILVNGQVAKFSAKEFWLENYATASKDTSDPNAMWAKRPFGQITKCAEAQALRKAFPEIASQPTAEEMEGKHEYIIDDGKENSSKVTAIKKIFNQSQNESPVTESKQPEKNEVEVTAFLEDIKTAETSGELKGIFSAAREYAKSINDKLLYTEFFNAVQERQKQLSGSVPDKNPGVAVTAEQAKNLDDSWEAFKNESENTEQ